VARDGMWGKGVGMVAGYGSRLRGARDEGMGLGHVMTRYVCVCVCVLQVATSIHSCTSAHPHPNIMHYQ